MFLLVATSIVVAMTTGYLAGGRIRALGRLRLTGIPLALAAVVTMIVAAAVESSDLLIRALIVTGTLLTGAFLVANAARSRGWIRIGFAVLALGWTLNATVMAANGGMPLSLDAYASSGQKATPTPGEHGFFKIVIATEDTKLRWLGDVIAAPPIHRVVSIGDLVLLLGFGIVIVSGMRGTDRGDDVALLGENRLTFAS